MLPRASRLVPLGCEEGLGLASIFWSWLLGVAPLNRPAAPPVHSLTQSSHPGSLDSLCSLCSLSTLPTRRLAIASPLQPAAHILVPGPVPVFPLPHFTPSFPPTSVTRRRPPPGTRCLQAGRRPLFLAARQTTFAAVRWCLLNISIPVASFFPFSARFRHMRTALRSPAAIAQHRRTRATITAHPHTDRSRTPSAVPSTTTLVSRRRNCDEKRRKHLTVWTTATILRSPRGALSTVRRCEHRLEAATRGKRARRWLTTLRVSFLFRPHANLDCRAPKRAAAETKHMRPLRRRLVRRSTTNPGCEPHISTV